MYPNPYAYASENQNGILNKINGITTITIYDYKHMFRLKVTNLNIEGSIK